MPQRLVLAALACLLAAPLFAAEPQFWRVEGNQEYLDGDLTGLSVDSEGHVTLSPESSVIRDPEAPFVWCLAADGKDTVYAGTGNDGRVWRIRDGVASVLFDSEQLEVHALAVGPDRRVYAGTSPDGKVYAIDRDGEAEEFYDPPDKYIWALAFDAEGRLLVATGLEGRLLRVGRDGTDEVLLATSEAHLMSLAVDDAGQAYVGSAPGGVVYRVAPDGRTFALLDSDYREVKALAAGPGGSLYAALIDGSGTTDQPSAPDAPPAAAPPGFMADSQVTVTVTPASAVQPAQSAPPAAPPSPGQGKGAVVRIGSRGDTETLWSSTSETPHALAWAPDGLYVGTGDGGKLYRVRDDRTWSMVGRLPSQQVTSLSRGKDGRLAVGTSNPGSILSLGQGLTRTGEFASKPRDTKTVSSWGRVAWEAITPGTGSVAVRTRSGNTAVPDDTWSDWSEPYADARGSAVSNRPARFLQLKVTLSGDGKTTPVLESLHVAYLQRNLRPEVGSITVHPPGVVFQRPITVTGQVELLGLDDNDRAETPPAVRRAQPGMAPAALAMYSRPLFRRGIQTFTWKAHDANGDDLLYDVEYRAAGETRYRPLRQGLDDAVLAWDTSTVPNGRYVIRVVARDSLDNPEALSLSGEKDSSVFEVDNTPPSIEARRLDGAPVRVHVVVRDDSSRVARAEYSVDGGRWREVYPEDGINDSLLETYDIEPGPVEGEGPHLLVVRARDGLGNVATARVEIP